METNILPLLPSLPSDDFYLYVNNNWITFKPIPKNFTRYGVIETIKEKVYDQFCTIIDKK